MTEIKKLYKKPKFFVHGQLKEVTKAKMQSGEEPYQRRP